MRAQITKLKIDKEASLKWIKQQYEKEHEDYEKWNLMIRSDMMKMRWWEEEIVKWLDLDEIDLLTERLKVFSGEVPSHWK